MVLKGITDRLIPVYIYIYIYIAKGKTPSGSQLYYQRFRTTGAALIR